MFIHETAEVSNRAILGSEVKVWNNAQIREDAQVGDNSIISKNVYIDSGVKIGKNCKLQNNVSVYHGVHVADGVFLGPHVCFTNDRVPRSINPDGSLKSEADWQVSETSVDFGASIGAHSVILPGVNIGRFALIGAGSVVTKDVAPHTVVVGNPAHPVSRICACGNKLPLDSEETQCKDCKNG